MVERTPGGAAGSARLRLNTPKCTVVPAAGILTTIQQQAFAGWRWRICQSIKVLGAAVGVGGGPLAEDIVEKRCAEATRVLERLMDLMDCQGAFQMLRLCGGFARLVYAIRCSPAGGSFDQLEAMDSRIREAFVTITRLPMDQEAWARAQRGGSAGGSGIRSMVRDSPCAFISSVLAAVLLQERMAPGTELADIMGDPAFQPALRALRGRP